MNKKKYKFFTKNIFFEERKKLLSNIGRKLMFWVGKNVFPVWKQTNLLHYAEKSDVRM